MHVLVVYNPVSGLGFLRPSRARIRREFDARGAATEWIETDPDAPDAVREAVGRPFDRIVVIGGDGTVREVAQFLIAAKSRTPIAILGHGTGNMLATSLGIPLFPLGGAVEYALKAPVEEIDVLLVNGAHVCLIGAGQGYDALFIKGATRDMKRRFGLLAYVWSFLRTFLPYRSQRYTIVVDGERHQVAAKLVLALNAFGIVGVPLERSISAHDGWIDVFVLNPRTLWETVWTGLGFLARRPRNKIPRLLSFRGKRVSIRQRKGRQVQIDGDIHPDKHLDIELLPLALRIAHEKPVDAGAAPA
jgi:diacylglycerol kinase family enzyme